MLYWVYMQTALADSTLDSFLREKKIKLPNTQRRYLHCLVMEHIALKKANGNLLSDVSVEDLNTGYKVFLYDHFLEKAQAIEEPKIGNNGIF